MPAVAGDKADWSEESDSDYDSSEESDSDYDSGTGSRSPSEGSRDADSPPEDTSAASRKEITKQSAAEASRSTEVFDTKKYARGSGSGSDGSGGRGSGCSHPAVLGAGADLPYKDQK